MVYNKKNFIGFMTYMFYAIKLNVNIITSLLELI